MIQQPPPTAPRSVRPEAQRSAKPAAGPVASPSRDLGRAAGNNEPATTDAAVREILAEVRRLGRRQAEASDAFNLPWVFGLLGQLAALVLAVGTPFLRPDWLKEAPLWLLAASFAQLFALTMFMLARMRR